MSTSSFSCCHGICCLFHFRVCSYQCFNPSLAHILIRRLIHINELVQVDWCCDNHQGNHQWLELVSSSKWESEWWQEQSIHWHSSSCRGQECLSHILCQSIVVQTFPSKSHFMLALKEKFIHLQSHDDASAGNHEWTAIHFVAINLMVIEIFPFGPKHWINKYYKTTLYPYLPPCS